MVPFERLAPAVVVVRYETAEDLKPTKNQVLLKALHLAAKDVQRPVTVIFHVSATVRIVDVEVLGFWLGVVSENPCPVSKMAIVTHSLAVRVAARGFAMATALRGLPIEVAVFAEFADAVAWG